MPHVTQSQLESYRWGAATLLRGFIDAGIPFGYQTDPDPELGGAAISRRDQEVESGLLGSAPI